jgi:hypothetical protein
MASAAVDGEDGGWFDHRNRGLRGATGGGLAEGTRGPATPPSHVMLAAASDGRSPGCARRRWWWAVRAHQAHLRHSCWRLGRVFMDAMEAFVLVGGWGFACEWI